MTMMNAGLGAIAPRNPNPMAPQPQPFQQLLDLNKAVKAANLQRAAQGQQAMAQAAQRPPTVKEELEMALRQAMPQQPAYAGGGAVSAGSAPAARSAGAGTARPAGAGAGLGAVAPQYDELTQLRRMYEQMAKDVEGTAAVDPRVLEARQAYDSVLKASMDPAEQQLRELEAQQSQNFFENPELMAAMLEGMKGSERLGETLFGAATGLVKARAGQKRERREAQANIIKLRQELAKAEAEARLARAEKDTEGERRAKLKAAEIRAAMDEKTYELKTKRISADASATAAANRPTAEQRGQLTQEDLARIYGQVSKELRGNDAIKAQVIRARVQAGKTGVPFNEEEYLQNLIQAEFENRIGAQSGRTMSPTPGQATTAPGATAPGWGPAKVVTP